MTAMRTLATASRAATRIMARATTAQKRAALSNLAAQLADQAEALAAENRADLEAAKKAGLSAALLDRLRLDVSALVRAVREIAALPDPVGQVTESWRRPNGLDVQRVRTPLGVILLVYEARPGVTVDAAALCILSGNAAILRGGSEAARTNAALAARVADALVAAGLPREAVQTVPTTDRAALAELLALDGLIDLAIPRGGEGLLAFVAEHARVPVLKHARGVCHVFLDASADPEMSTRIVVNAKAQRPGVCNAAECLLVHEVAAPALLAHVGRALADAKVELRAEPRALALLRQADVPAIAATETDFGREFLALTLAVKVVTSLDDALAHIERYGSLHSEAIVTNDLANARRFTREIDASCVLVNASTRFNDGGELGLGAEIGISTSKLHAYGAMGLRELTTTRFVVTGDGQVRI